MKMNRSIVRVASCSLAALLLCACKPQAVDPASAQSMAAEPTVEEAAKPAVPLDIAALLHCGEGGFLRLSTEEQAKAMAAIPTWQCEADAQGLHCNATEPQRAFGARVSHLMFVKGEGGPQQHMQLNTDDTEEVLSEAARVWGLQRTDDNLLALDEAAKMVLSVDYNNNGSVDVSCAISGEGPAPRLPADWQRDPLAVEGGAGFASKAYPVEVDQSEGVAFLKGDALRNALATCQAEHWLSQDFDTRVRRLEEVGARCERKSENSRLRAECRFDAPLKGFGGKTTSMVRVDEDPTMHESVMFFETGADALAQAMQKDTMTELTPFPGAAGMYQNLLDDRYQHIVFAVEGGSELVCRMSENLPLGED